MGSVRTGATQCPSSGTMAEGSRRSNISYEEALDMLQSMFSDWDRETLSMVLESNNYHVESTIEQLLAMTGGQSTGPETEEKKPASNTAATENLLDLNIDDSRTE